MRGTDIYVESQRLIAEISELLLRLVVWQMISKCFIFESIIGFISGDFECEL